MEDLKERFCDWKRAFENNSFKDHIKKNKSDGKWVGRKTAQNQDRPR